MSDSVINLYHEIQKRKWTDSAFSNPFIQPRVKKIIQANPDICKIQHTVPFVCVKSLELFLIDIVAQCKEVSQTSGL